MDIFSVKIQDKYLIYAPLHQVTALVNGRATDEISRCLLGGDQSAHEALQTIVESLLRPTQVSPQPRSGDLADPFFLGIIPTRGCNMGCIYCDFARPKKTSPVMSLDTARNAVDSYLDLLQRSGSNRAEIHFFGGEPFFAESVVAFTVAYAEVRAAQMGLKPRFDVITNGIFSEKTCRWIADHFDTVVVSLDGPEDVQECQRPSLGGRPTIRTILRNLEILADSPAELHLRSCITSNTVRRMPEIAEWFGKVIKPGAVCFESLTRSPESREAGLLSPDPWEFALNFTQAAQILEGYGIDTILSTALVHKTNASFCPVGKDALIVSPDGRVDACYLLEEDWQEKGLDMHLGHLNGRGFDIDRQALERIRRMTVYEKPLCANCLCRYHCAGACHVNHDTSSPSGHYDEVCIQTRLVTIAELLRQLGQSQLMDIWFNSRDALEASIYQKSDRLCSPELIH